MRRDTIWRGKAFVGPARAGDLSRDVRHGVRALAAAPRFTIVALLTIVLMVGGISTIFSLVHGVLLRPLPFPDADRLVILKSMQEGRFGSTVFLGDVSAFRNEARSFDGWALYRVGYVEEIPGPDGEPFAIQDLQVTPDIFPMLGMDVAMGRTLLPTDADAGAPPVAVISHDLWQRRFGGRSDVVGGTIGLRWGAFTIVGVTRPGADVPTNWLTYPILWRPVGATEDAETRFTTLARLRRDASIEAGRAELTTIAARLAAAYPQTHTGRGASATLLHDEIVGSYKRVLWIFFSAVTCVLLIGVGNLISLQLARNGARERDIVVRAALGASRWRIVRQLAVESLLLGGAGGVLGLAAAWPAVGLITATLPPRFPRADLIEVNGGVALFAAAVTLAVALIVGLVPAWQASRVDLTSRLGDSGRSATPGAARSRLQRSLIAFQTAVALILLVAAGLLANSFYRLISRDAGMREDGLWLVTATLPSRVRGDAAQNAFWTAALAQVRAVPGVESAAVSVNGLGPLSGSDISTSGVAPEGVKVSGREGLNVSYRRVSDGYFHALGMPTVKGRPILPSDTAGGEPVVVINELAAAALWPGQDPIGRRLQALGGLKTVVGVIPTFRHARLDGDLRPQLFTPYLQRMGIATTSVIVVRTAPGDRATPAAVRSALLGLEGDLQVRVATMGDVRWRLLATERFRMAVLVSFAGSAVFLALVGIFGLVSYAIGQRQREIAVRVALGAVRRDVLRVASRQALAPAGFGLALGVAGAGLATRLLTSYLVDIQPLDPATFAAALGVLAAAALAAGVIPARRALTINPADALRSE